MLERWGHDMMDLHWLKNDPTLAPGGPEPLQRRLYRALRQAVVDGRLQAGAVLPSTRGLASALKVARNTVLYAYEQLAAEGYVQADRQGTVVRALERPGRRVSRGVAMPALSSRSTGFQRPRSAEEQMRPFVPGNPALDAFPWPVWQRVAARAVRHSTWRDAGYRDAAGEPELRQAIATYLRASRGVNCGPEQVVITEGTQEGLALCAMLLADGGDTAWIEHPGYGGAYAALRAAGLRCVPVTVDAEGMAPAPSLWQQAPPRLIYTTPSHQYPLGSVLSLPRRLALLAQARTHGAWILEDDYDSEFRHAGPPLAAMQGLEPDAPVAYLGTFSKTLFPGLRLGFVVLPASAVERAAGLAGALWPRGRATEQRTLAAFIDEGHFTRHLRRMRVLYAERQQALREALARHWRWPGVVLGGDCGMHLVLALPDNLPDVALARAASRHGLGPRALSAYGTGGPGGFNGLVMGYAHVPAEHLATHVGTLARIAGDLLAPKEKAART